MSDLNNIIKILNKGGTILYPTDTVWGLGCDATNQKAVEKIHKIKKSRPDDRLPIIVSSLEMLHKYVESIHPRLETLLFYHQRPLTVIFDQCKNLPGNISDRSGSVAMRVTHDPFCLDLIDGLGRPIVATAASYIEECAPIKFAHVSLEIARQVDYVERPVHTHRESPAPSVVVRLGDGAELQFLRL